MGLVLCYWKKVSAMTNVFLIKFFCHTSVLYSKVYSKQVFTPNLSVIPGISGLPTFALQSPMMKRTSFVCVCVCVCVCVLVLESVLSLPRTSQLELLWHQGLGQGLGLQ